MKHLIGRATALALAAAFLAGTACTKKRPYETLVKPETEEKLKIDTTQEYLYVASGTQSDRTASKARPFWMGQEKIVKFRFTKKALVAEEPETDERFKGNSLNAKPVLSIPVEHLDYRCAKDGNGECTNKEEANSDLPWDQRNYFKPDFNGLSLSEISILPLELANLEQNCYSETGAEIVDYKLEETALNIKVQRTYKTNADCLPQTEDALKDASFAVQYQYSFVRLSAVAGREYEPVDYPRPNHSHFGFFAGNSKVLSPDLKNEMSSEKFLLNRWNPKRKQVTYYMSDNMAKPEYSLLRDATREVFAAVNEGLRDADIDTEFVIKDPAGKDPGDIRNNMIVLVEDPLADSVLGYGPVAANPKTGEIVHARVVMYLGNIITGLREGYDEFVAEAAERKAEKAMKAKKVADLLSAGTNSTSRVASARQASAGGLPPHLKARVKPTKLTETLLQAFEDSALHQHAPDSTVNKQNEKEPLPTEARKMLKKGLTVNRNIRSSIYKQLIANASDEERKALENPASRRAEVLSKYAYTAPVFNFGDVIGQAVEGDMQGGDLKPWAQLSDTEKKAMVTKLSAYVWRSILIHEMGHNLGLRHNFRGSFDKDNFYGGKEPQMVRYNLRQYPFSSVMDYGYSDLNALRVFGKYDLAALRFGYRGEVTTNSGALVPAAGVNLDKLEEQYDENADKAEEGGDAEADKLRLKKYRFCTDENVGSALDCHRFDEGTSLAGVARHKIRSYEEFYRRRNLRDNRAHFRAAGDIEYLQARLDNFIDFRMFLEAYSDLKTGMALFGYADDPKAKNNVWKTNPFLKDMKSAVLIGGKFFMDLLTLPEIQCVIAEHVADVKTADTAKLVFVDTLPLPPSVGSCQDLNLGPQLSIVGETGRSFLSRRFQDNPLGSKNEIDIRGIWIDKLLALELLMNREISADLEPGHGLNYTDVPELTRPIAGTLVAAVLDEVVSDLPVTLYNGGRIRLTAANPLGSTQEIPMAPGLIRKFLDLPNGSSFLQRQIIQSVRNNLTVRNPELGRDTKAAFQVTIGVSFSKEELEERGMQVFDLNGERFIASPANILPQILFASINGAVTLAKYKPQQVDAIEKKAAVVAGGGPALTDAENAVMAVDEDVRAKFKEGALHGVNFYVRLLRTLVDLDKQ